MIGFGGSGGSAAKKTLELEIKLRADNTQASKSLQGLAGEADKVAAGLGKATQAAAGLNQAVGRGGPGGNPFPASMFPTAPAPTGLFPSGMRGPLAPPSGTFPASMSPTMGGGYNFPTSMFPKAPPPPPPAPNWYHRNLGGMPGVEAPGFEKAAGQFAVVTLAAEAAVGVADAFGKIAVSAGTARQKVDQLSGAIPIVGHVATALTRASYGIADAFSEHTIRMRDPAYNLYRNVERPIAAQMYGVRSEMERQQGQLGRDLAEQTQRAQLSRGMTPLDYGASALAGFGFSGPLATVDPRIQDAQRARRKAEYEMKAAWGSAFGAHAAAKETYGRVAEEFGDAQGNNSRLGDLRLRDATGDLIKEYQRSRTDPYAEKSFRLAQQNFGERTERAGADLARYEKEIAEAKERGLAAAQKDYELAQAKTNELRSQVAVLRDKEEQSRASAVGYGMMDPEGRAHFLHAAARFDQGGIDSLPPDLKAALAGNPLTAGRLAEAAERKANEDPQFRALQEKYGVQDSATIRAERLKLEQEVKIKIEYDEQQFYELVERVLKKFNEQNKDALQKKFELEEAKRIAQQIQSNTAGN